MAGCAFLGLGVMGGPMARHLSQNGHDIGVWNRSPEKIKAWLDKGGQGEAKFLPQVTDGVEFIFFCLGRNYLYEHIISAELSKLSDGRFSRLAIIRRYSG